MQINRGAAVQQSNGDDAAVRRRIQVGIRIALEEMLVERDYARVENILRALCSEAEAANGAASERHLDA